ncbi:hypothetical protein H310_11742 [Aphanomyces invadans]|uniref:NAD-specific glutamate dehydrogenase n=1 Tax=Aphanomyces invadans TaxID=157072 RepID=A0A024TN48_9STRA|nr:hypothetical protein H310_11742 [Aphanomyces invadans]ETV94787.1 hypothetical protein H310_11742 [Aphanomyces invadans]|eukprot:XP_008876732.1 hypothetical protein H310_11742 [Aphanomyces invadans]
MNDFPRSMDSPRRKSIVNRSSDATLFFLQLQFLDVFPGEVLVVAPKVTIGGGLLHNGALQLQVTLDATRAKVEVLLRDFNQVVVGHTFLDGAVRVDVNGQGVRHTNGVRQLHNDALGQTMVDQRLGNPASGVGGRTIDLGRVLAGESTATVGTPTAVGINDDLATGQTSITVRATNDETARRVQVVHGLVIEVLFRDDGENHVVHQVPVDLFVGHIRAVLGRDDNGVDTLGDHAAIDLLVFDRDLGLAIGADPVNSAVFAHFGQLGTQLGRQDVGQGHQFGGFVGGIAEHDTLVTSTNVFVLGTVDGSTNFRGLLFNRNNHVDGLVVQALGGVIVTDFLDGLADHFFVVDRATGGDFTEDHHHAGLGAGFACDTGVGVLCNASIQHCIGNLIAQLVGVTFVDGFRGEEEGAIGGHLDTCEQI